MTGLLNLWCVLPNVEVTDFWTDLNGSSNCSKWSSLENGCSPTMWKFSVQGKFGFWTLSHFPVKLVTAVGKDKHVCSSNRREEQNSKYFNFAQCLRRCFLNVELSVQLRCTWDWNTKQIWFGLGKKAKWRAPWSATSGPFSKSGSQWAVHVCQERQGVSVSFVWAFVPNRVVTSWKPQDGSDLYGSFLACGWRSSGWTILSKKSQFVFRREN